MNTHTCTYTYTHTYTLTLMPSDLEMKRTLMQKTLAQPGTKTWGKGTGRSWGQVFSLDPMSKAVNSQKALQRLATTEGSLSLYSPKAGKHVTVVTLAGEVETASTFRYRSILARGSSRNSWVSHSRPDSGGL